MRILFCNFEYPPLGGGGGVINALLAEELANRHEVTVLTSQGLGLPRREVVNGVRVERVPVFFRREQAAANMPSMLAYLPMGAAHGLRLFREQPFDIINTHFALPSGPVGSFLSHRTGTPNVLSVHGGDLYDPSKASSPHRHALLRVWIRRLLKDADQVVGQSANTIDNVGRFYTREVEPRLIPLGIRRPAWAPADRKAYGFSDTDFLMVSVGRLVARKAMDQLVRMLKDLEDPAAHLLLVGSGPQEESLRRLAAELGVEARVHFLGFVSEEEKFGVLQMCDLFVSTSQHEGFGIVFLEAMASGLPVVCYDHGGQTDFLEDGVTGHLLRLNDEATLRARCRELMHAPDALARMGETNRRRVERFYIENCAREYEALFDDVIRRRKH